MKRATPVLLSALAALFVATAPAMEAPLPLKDLRKPVEVVQEQVDEEPVLPSAVSPERRVADVAAILPEGAVWFVAVPETARMVRDWDASPPGALMNEPTMEVTIRNNRFGLTHLFGDLPASVIEAERVRAVAAVMELSHAYAKMSEKMGMASYIDAEGSFSYVFVFDIGLDRIPAFEKMGDWETSFFIDNPGASVVRDDHSGNFLDIWRLKDRGDGSKGGEIAAGFAENMAIVSNNSALAAECLGLLGGGNSLAQSPWGVRLASSVPASGSADAVAFLRMDALLEGLRQTPIARNAVASWADYIGQGGGNGEALYYGLQFTPEGTRETFLLPAAGDTGAASLVELLAKRLRHSDRWTTPNVIPYQPNPIVFVGAMLEGRQLGGLLRQDSRLFGVSAGEGTFQLPPEVRPIFSNEMIMTLTGEVGMAQFPNAEGGIAWLLAIPCNSNPAPLLRKADYMTDRSGSTIYSNEENWRTKTSWCVVTSENFRRVNGNFLLIASTGDVLIATLDQLAGGSSFAANKDFSRAIAQTEANQGMVFYLNIPEILVRQYPNLSHIMRALYPRSSGLNSRPPLSVLRRYAKGMLAVISPINGGNGDFTRMTVQAPLPALGLMAAGTVVSFPASLRQDGRADMEKSRENLKNLWMRMQLYSSRFGHFPDSLDDLAAELRVSMTGDELRSLMTAPAALSRLTPDEAAVSSYKYLSGVTPNDEPDIPLIYEAEPWSEDFSGMFPPDSNRAPSESGEYQRFRQLVLLDGTGLVVSEKYFQEKIVPRMAERE